MKRFKKFLVEEMASDKVTADATPTTPQSSVTPPAPAMFAPDSVKQQYARTVGQQDPNLQPEEEEEKPEAEEPEEEEWTIDPRTGERITIEEWERRFREWQERNRREREAWEEERRRRELDEDEYEFWKEFWMKNFQRAYGANPSSTYVDNIFYFIYKYNEWVRNGRIGPPPPPP